MPSISINASSRSPSRDRRPTTKELLDRKPMQTPISQYPVANAPPLRHRAHFVQNRWLEIGPCFMFMVALVAIVVTLRPYPGKPSG